MFLFLLIKKLQRVTKQKHFHFYTINNQNKEYNIGFKKLSHDIINIKEFNILIYIYNFIG